MLFWFGAEEAGHREGEEPAPVTVQEMEDLALGLCGPPYSLLQNVGYVHVCASMCACIQRETG